jgi:L-ribulose-5-phosphate 3-epimerase
MTNPEPQAPAALSRRDFVGRLALAGAALPLPGLPGQAATAAAAAPTCIHVFAKGLQWLSYADTAAMIAEAGYGGVDYTVRPGGHVLPERAGEDLPRAVEAARRAGLAVEMISTGITQADRHAEVIVRTAAKLGIKYYRLGNFDYDFRLGVRESLQRLQPALKDIAALNQAHGIHGALQNHAGLRVGAAVWDLYELLRGHDPRWLGCQYDIRHATAEGGLSWPVPLRLIAPWIRCTNIKDLRWVQTANKAVPEVVPLGEGIVDFDQYFKLVRELRLGGPISMHLEYPPFERARPALSDADKRRQFPPAMRKDLAVLRQLMAKHQLR